MMTFFLTLCKLLHRDKVVLMLKKLVAQPDLHASLKFAYRVTLLNPEDSMGKAIQSRCCHYPIAANKFNVNRTSNS